METRRKIQEDTKMLYDLMAIAADAPATGDNFPIKIIIIVAVVAAAVAGGTAVFTKKKK